MEHFIFLLEKLGFEVKQGKHIAVKVPGMKRFKRLDTISEDLCRESLEAMFRYGDASLAALVNRAVSLLPARKAVFSPYQRKYYAMEPSMESEKFILTDKPHSTIRKEGFPLDSISLDIKTNKYYYDLPEDKLEQLAVEDGFLEFFKNILNLN